MLTCRNLLAGEANRRQTVPRADSSFKPKFNLKFPGQHWHFQVQVDCQLYSCICPPPPSLSISLPLHSLSPGLARSLSHCPTHPPTSLSPPSLSG